MTAKRLYYVLLGAIGVMVLLLFGSVYAANSFLQGQSKRVADARLDTLVIEEKKQGVAKAKADIEKYKSLAVIADSIVPQDKDQAQTVREIVNIAAAHGIKLGTLTFPSSALGVLKPTPGNNPALSQLRLVPGIAGVYSLDITVESATNSPADYNQFVNFLNALEHNRRTALVTSITLQPNVTDPSKLTFSLILNEYIKK